nr:MAG TPA: hypothetical protein [Bacteriophage sp.]
MLIPFVECILLFLVIYSPFDLHFCLKFIFPYYL